MTLTKRQKEIRDYLATYVEAHGYAPTIEEIGRHFGLSSPATVHKHLCNLEDKGVITRGWNLSRAIELTPLEETAEAIDLPLLGQVAAGVPIEAVETQEKLSVPVDFVRRPSDAFALRVRGESMVGEGILDGDYVVVESRPIADNGETVVALIDGDATVKKFHREAGGQICLQPANPTMEPIRVPAHKVEVRGVVVAVVRRYR